jgi:hypothetical protein
VYNDNQNIIPLLEDLEFKESLFILIITYLFNNLKQQNKSIYKSELDGLLVYFIKVFIIIVMIKVLFERIKKKMKIY